MNTKQPYMQVIPYSLAIAEMDLRVVHVKVEEVEDEDLSIIKVEDGDVMMKVAVRNEAPVFDSTGAIYNYSLPYLVPQGCIRLHPPLSSFTRLHELGLGFIGFERLIMALKLLLAAGRNVVLARRIVVIFGGSGATLNGSNIVKVLTRRRVVAYTFKGGEGEGEKCWLNGQFNFLEVEEGVKLDIRHP
ncbi:hypothetical protein LR48_Vigan07g081300 [Vigna angularis]|uniref:Uncharacterized protein n=1 Tax=Phaseolus angularis TaxID=3914 RepID=A0A0L9UX43_PHAAN|nr:hypothetical protein LR48_Vigan07g081300 [Vigna angularis]